MEWLALNRDEENPIEVTLVDSSGIEIAKSVLGEIVFEAGVGVWVELGGELHLLPPPAFKKVRWLPNSVLLVFSDGSMIGPSAVVALEESIARHS